MTKDGQDEDRRFAGALPVSVAIHAAAILLLIFGLPVSLFQPTKDDVISVDLVPPPEETKKAEEAKQEPPPPPPPAPEKADEQAKAAQQKEAKKEPPPPPNVIRPVVQFGEKDAGPRVSPSGDSAEEKAAAEAKQADKQGEKAAAPLALAVESPGPAPQPDAAGAPAADAPKLIQEKKPLDLDEAKRLFSLSETGDAMATSAMDKLPRSARAAHLCSTQLRDQLRNGMPPYYPELVPSYPLLEGHVMEVPDAAFRARGRWYELGFRCQVDDGATKVVTFAYRVGKPIPRNEWEARKLPAD